MWQVSKTEDPRGPWAVARRMELVRYAHELGHIDIVEQMPKELIVKRLQALGVPPPSVPPRPIGIGNPRSGDTDINSHKYNGAKIKTETERVEISAEDLMEREWSNTIIAQDNFDKMSINELRNECKARGIKLARTDRVEHLKAKLRNG